MKSYLKDLTLLDFIVTSCNKNLYCRHERHLAFLIKRHINQTNMNKNVQTQLTVTAKYQLGVRKPYFNAVHSSTTFTCYPGTEEAVGLHSSTD